MNLDFSIIADHKLSGIEIVNLTGSSDNQIHVTLHDVLSLTDHGKLRIDGDTGDS